MPITKVKTKLDQLSTAIDETVFSEPCTGSELRKVHDQFQQAILDRDPTNSIRKQNLMSQLLAFEETNPVIGKAIKDLVTVLSGMGI